MEKRVTHAMVCLPVFYSTLFFKSKRLLVHRVGHTTPHTTAEICTYTEEPNKRVLLTHAHTYGKQTGPLTIVEEVKLEMAKKS